MPPRKWPNVAARARAGKATIDLSADSSSESDDCHWDGTEGHKVPQFIPSVSHHEDPGSASEWDCEIGLLPPDDQSSESDRDLEGSALLASFACAAEADEATMRTAYEQIIEHKSQTSWTTAETNLGGFYSGNSARTQRRIDKNLRDKEELDKASQASSESPTALAFTSRFTVLPRTTPGVPQIPIPVPPISVPSVVLPVPPAVTTPLVPSVNSVLNVQPVNQAPEANEIFTGYISDVSPSELSEGGETHAAGGIARPAAIPDS
ncbi:hypothetical protein B0H10DRAFT_1959078 [Mycena sp. CBHHK59/15]|nr:hypothetical protein B0H10DRAFT_1959078 [Mycena sp. CBHHK59/15]